MSDRGDNVFVSIVIPALNEEEMIGKCLDSLCNLNTPKSSYEVILVDNGSKDRTCSIAEDFKGRLDLGIVVERDANIGKLRNIGASYARGNIFAFVDADCTVTRDWMNHALRDLEDPTIGAVGSSHNTPADASWVGRAWDLNIGRRRRLGDVESLPSGNLFVRREDFLKISGFNEELTTNEDYDLCFRLQRVGLRIYSDPKISSTHWGVPSDLVSFYRKQRWHGTHVLKVFTNNLREFRNLRAVSFGVYYAFCIVGFVTSVLVIGAGGSSIYMIMDIFALVIPGLLLSLRVAKGQKGWYKYLIRLFVLYSVYGLARAMSVFGNMISMLHR